MSEELGRIVVEVKNDNSLTDMCARYTFTLYCIVDHFSGNSQREVGLVFAAGRTALK